MNNIIPSNKHAIIRLCKHILNIDSIITETHVMELKTVIQDHLNLGMSPSDIAKHYQLTYSDFGMFIKKCLNIQLKSSKDAVNNYNIRSGRALTDKKKIYKNNCSFKFNPYSITNLPGYELLLQSGIYHSTKNPSGVCRDHIMSIEFGWMNNIDPRIISSHHNCQFITNLENISKSSRSYITIDELLHRISNNILEPITPSRSTIRTLSEDHKQKISETNMNYMCITNKIHNIRVLKGSDIPEGYSRGLTRKSKFVKK